MKPDEFRVYYENPKLKKWQGRETCHEFHHTCNKKHSNKMMMMTMTRQNEGFR